MKSWGGGSSLFFFTLEHHVNTYHHLSAKFSFSRPTHVVSHDYRLMLFLLFPKGQMSLLTCTLAPVAASTKREKRKQDQKRENVMESDDDRMYRKEYMNVLFRGKEEFFSRSESWSKKSASQISTMMTMTMKNKHISKRRTSFSPLKKLKRSFYEYFSWERNFMLNWTSSRLFIIILSYHHDHFSLEYPLLLFAKNLSKL